MSHLKLNSETQKFSLHSSIIVGSLFHSQHMQRGVYTRAKEAIDTVLKKENDGRTEPSGPFTSRRPLLASRSNPS